MRRFAVVSFLAVLMVSGHQVAGQDKGGIKHTPTVEAITNEIRLRKIELKRLEKDMQAEVQRYEAQIAVIKKMIQELQAEKARRMNEDSARELAAARKSTENDKLDLILKKLESLEKRIINLEKKGSTPKGAKQ